MVRLLDIASFFSYFLSHLCSPARNHRSVFFGQGERERKGEQLSERRVLDVFKKKRKCVGEEEEEEAEEVHFELH